MKKIYSDSTKWSNTEIWIVSEEEYQKLLEEYKGHDNGREPQWDKDCGVWRVIPNYKQVYLNKDFTVYPTTMILDGYASRGGVNFKANGIEVTTDCGYKNHHKYYTTDDRIKVNEQVKTTGWWTA